MSEILVKGREMPKCCEDCMDISTCYPNDNDEDTYDACMNLSGDCDDVSDAIAKGIRSEKCPLVEVKPHGRLIDIDALRESMVKEIGCPNPSNMKMTPPYYPEYPGVERRQEPERCEACPHRECYLMWLDMMMKDTPTFMEANE